MKYPAALLLAMICALPSPMRAEHFFRPFPYSEGRIYILAVSRHNPKHPSADYVRSHAARVVLLGEEPLDHYIIDFWDYLRWGNARNDPKIKRHAGPITMVIDLYRRLSPPDSENPEFETLYCTKRAIYSDEGDYLPMRPPVSTHVQSFLK